MQPHLGAFAALVALGLARAAAGAEVDLEAAVHEHRLGNGMVWLLVERHEAPVFTGYIRVKAGGADEPRGQSGLAHLFEHLAFKGTPVLGAKDFPKEQALLEDIARTGSELATWVRAGKGSTPEARALKQRLDVLGDRERAASDPEALSALYQRSGADALNATTDKDLTSFYVSLPRNRLEMWALTEAQRLASPVLRDFYRERDVVLEERRLRVDAEAAGVAYEVLNQVAFTESPYRTPVVGYPEDLGAMTLEAADDFHRRYYVPQNAVGCIVGDFDWKNAERILDRTFDAIPRAPDPPPVVFTEPEQHAGRRAEIPFDAAPHLLIGFHKPAMPAPDDYVFDVLEVLLGQGLTARLHKRLVLVDRTAGAVEASTAPGDRFDNLFVVAALPLGEERIGQVEQGVWSELGKLRDQPVSPAELKKAQARLEADRARSVESSSGLASTLTLFQALAGDWRYILRHGQVVAKLTPADVQRVAKQYFVPENATTVVLRRPARRP